MDYSIDETLLFDEEEVHGNCTVQILKNTITGEISVGWWENNKEAEWLLNEDCDIYCSCCKSAQAEPTKYCPECGSPMTNYKED